MAGIREDALKKPVDVAEYLFTRLSQVGIRSVHGLPGDYNLVALDYLPKANLKWVGSVNELNAGKSRPGSADLEYGKVLTTLSRLCRRWLRPRQGHLRHHHDIRRRRAVCYQRHGRFLLGAYPRGSHRRMSFDHFPAQRDAPASHSGQRRFQCVRQHEC